MAYLLAGSDQGLELSKINYSKYQLLPFYLFMLSEGSTQIVGMSF